MEISFGLTHDMTTFSLPFGTKGDVRDFQHSLVSYLRIQWPYNIWYSILDRMAAMAEYLIRLTRLGNAALWSTHQLG